MDYKRFDDTILVRMDRGEEILEQVKAVALKEQVTLASVQALGAINDFTVGVYNVAEKKYYANDFKGSFEIVSLTGTIDTMNGEFYTHLHLSAGNDRGEVFGGHLNRAIISATAEIQIQVIDGEIGREFSQEIGLNLFKF
mgnify:CR=1 FL=1